MKICMGPARVDLLVYSLSNWLAWYVNLVAAVQRVLSFSLGMGEARRGLG